MPPIWWYARICHLIQAISGLKRWDRREKIMANGSLNSFEFHGRAVLKFLPTWRKISLFVWIDTDVDFYILYGYQASWGPMIREPWPGSSVVCHSDGGARVKQSVNKSKGTVTMVTILVSSNVVWWCNAWHIISLGSIRFNRILWVELWGRKNVLFGSFASPAGKFRTARPVRCGAKRFPSFSTFFYHTLLEMFRFQLDPADLCLISVWFRSCQFG